MVRKWFRGAKGSEDDKELFRASEEILGEETLRAFLELLREEKTFYTGNRVVVLEFLRFFEEEGHRFENRRVQEKLQLFLQALKELKVITAVHFLVFPRNQTGDNLRHTLHPDYFILEMQDISMDEHQFFLRAEKQLQEVCEQAKAACEAYLKEARKRLGL